jgi:hypothetical protein
MKSAKTSKGEGGVTKKRSSRPLEDIFRPTFFEACGGRCVDCGAEGELQIGHIQRREDDGPDTLENYQPLCSVCNGKHNAEFTMVDMRPSDWRDRFLKLLAEALSTELRVRVPSPVFGQGAHPPSVIDSPESNGVIPWERATFTFNISLSRTLSGACVPPIDTWTATVNEAIKKAADHVAPISPPSEQLRCKMIQQVRRLGCDGFKQAVNEFLRQEKWYDGRMRLMPFPWQTFSDNIDHYSREAELYKQQCAANAAAQKAFDEQIKAEARKEARKHRWQAIQACLKITWPGIPTEDSLFVQYLHTLTEDRVTEDDSARATELWRRYREYFKHTRKARALERVDWTRGLILGSEYNNNKNSAEEIRKLEIWVKQASDDDPELDNVLTRCKSILEMNKQGLRLHS